MKLSCNIKVNHLTRVEGHGNIQIRIQDGMVREARWEVVETPRFFEAMLVGKAWENAPSANSRRKKLGILKARKNTSASAPAPKKNATTISRTSPNTREIKVITDTRLLDFSSPRPIVTLLDSGSLITFPRVMRPVSQKLAIIL